MSEGGGARAAREELLALHARAAVHLAAAAELLAAARFRELAARAEKREAAAAYDAASRALEEITNRIRALADVGGRPDAE